MNEICIEKFPQKTDAEKYVCKINKKINNFFVELVEFCKEKNIEVYCKINNMVYSINELNRLNLIPFVKFEEEIKYYRIIYFAEPKYDFLFYDKAHQFTQGWSITNYEMLFTQNKDLIDCIKNLEIFKEKFVEEKIIKKH